MKELSFDICNRFYSIMLKHQSDDNLSLVSRSNTVCIDGDEGRLYMRLFRDELQIAYIVFKNRRVGTATDIVNECINVCKELNLKRIVIQGVLTEEMELFCNKMNFSKIEDQFGNKDYELVI